LTRTYFADDLDTIRRTLGEDQSLVQSAVVLAAQVLELHEQGLGPVAIARTLGLSRFSVARLLARRSQS
jgi:hypothetical protein